MTDVDRLRQALGARYAIDREVGAGGMATVYLAEDVRHRRKVAVKVLRPELSASLGAQRFHREIEVAAQLQHPHILPLLDSGEADAFLYYVMPFVEGESLRERLARSGELPVHEAVKLVLEIVDALAYAHSRGVVHRDIKPDNVMLTGRHALITDFGVAKAVSEATGRHTLTSVGVALGTPAYMAPEQATADPHIDHRVDIYAVGALSYELLTGHPPFAGRSPQEILAAHVTQAPEAVNTVRPSIPAAVSDVVMKCLAKRPADRWQSGEELMAQLEPLLTPTMGVTPAHTRPVSPAVRKWSPRSRAFWFATGALVLAAAAFSLTVLPGSAPAFTLGRAQPIAFDAALEIDPAISPDGKSVAYTAGPLTRMRVYVRQAGSRPIAVVADSLGGQRRPLWSPDGTQLLYQSGRLFVVAALGGVPRVVTNFGVLSAAWSPDGQQIAYSRNDSLFTRALDGGEERALLGSTTCSSLTWSPDGRYIAFVSGDPRWSIAGIRDFGNTAPAQIMVIRADGSSSRPEPVSDARSMNVSPAWMPDSRTLLFVSNRDGPRDVYSTTLGEADQPPHRVTSGLNPHSITLSADGTRMAYSAYIARSNIWAIPLTPGRVATMADARPVTTGNQLIEAPTISADGKSLLYDSDREGPVEIYRIPVAGGEPVRLTNDPAPKFNPSESPDGRWVVFHGFKYGNRDIFVVPRDGGEMTRLTTDTLHDQLPQWSPGGSAIAFFRYGGGVPRTPYVMRRIGDGSWGEPVAVGPAGSGTAFWYSDTVVMLFEGGSLVRRTLSGREIGTLYAWPPGRAPLSPRMRNGALYFRQYDPTGASTFWRVARAGAAALLIARLDDPTRPGSRAEFDTDGRVIYTTIADRQSDVFVAELTRR